MTDENQVPVPLIDEARIEAALVPHRRGKLYALLADEIERLRSERDALREWLQWALDNCDDSAEWTFGTDATEQMRALLAECRIALMWPGEPAQEFLDRIDAAIAKESP